MMTNEERDVIENFFSRIANPQASGAQTAVAPIDQQANTLITQECNKYPYAQYRMAQVAIVQEAALVQAQNQIRQLQMQVQQLQQQMQAMQQKQGGFFSNLFGGRNNGPQTPPPGYGARPMGAVPPQYQQQGQNLPYGMRPSSFRGGSGFLGSALSTATGVAGGVLAANALTSLFSGHHGAGFDPSAGTAGFTGADTGGGFMDSAPAADTGATSSDPFGGGGQDADPGFDLGDDDEDWGGGGFDDGGGFDGGF